MELVLRLTGTLFLATLCGAAILSAISRDGDSASEAQGVEMSETERSERSTLSSNSSERNDVFYQAIMDRPVFEKTRRPLESLEPPVEPEEVIVEDVPPPEAELPQVRLLGVMSAGTRTQVLISVDEQEPIWLTEGQKIQGWTIAKAGEDWLELAANKKTMRLELFE